MAQTIDLGRVVGKDGIDGVDGKDGVSARDLLDNSNFKNPVNQRGKTSYAVSWAYTIDRWRCTNAELVVSYDENGLTLDLSAGTSERRLYQKLALAPGRYTLAVCVGDVISTAVFTYSGTAISNAVETNNTPNFKAYAGIDGEYVAVSLQVIAGAVITGIKWAALYEGEYTADNLPPYVPKGYAVELAECRMYYRQKEKTDATDGLILAGYVTSSGKEIFVALDGFDRMRNGVKPSLSYVGKMIIRGVGGYSTDATASAMLSDMIVTPVYSGYGIAAMKITKPDETAFAGLTNNTPVTITGNIGAYLAASSDL